MKMQTLEELSLRKNRPVPMCGFPFPWRIQVPSSSLSPNRSRRVKWIRQFLWEIVWLRTHASFADDEESITSCTLPNYVLTLTVMRLQFANSKMLHSIYHNNYIEFQQLSVHTSFRTSAILINVSSGSWLNVGTLQDTKAWQQWKFQWMLLG